MWRQAKLPDRDALAYFVKPAGKGSNPNVDPERPKSPGEYNFTD